jgi:hypothetical protein
MNIYRFYDLRPRELQALYDSIGGQFTLRERWAKDGIGSPLLYYLDGHPELDFLKDKASDELRINLEEFKAGLMVRIAERTNPYILPLKTEEVMEISIHLKAEIVTPRKRSLFAWLLSQGFEPAKISLLARGDEYEERKTDFTIHTKTFSIHCWTTAAEYARVVRFFEKSNFMASVKTGGN